MDSNYDYNADSESTPIPSLPSTPVATSAEIGSSSERSANGAAYQHDVGELSLPNLQHSESKSKDEANDRNCLHIIESESPTRSFQFETLLSRENLDYGVVARRLVVTANLPEPIKPTFAFFGPEAEGPPHVIESESPISSFPNVAMLREISNMKIREQHAVDFLTPMQRNIKTEKGNKKPDDSCSKPFQSIAEDFLTTESRNPGKFLPLEDLPWKKLVITKQGNQEINFVKLPESTSPILPRSTATIDLTNIVITESTNMEHSALNPEKIGFTHVMEPPRNVTIHEPQQLVWKEEIFPDGVKELMDSIKVMSEFTCALNISNSICTVRIEMFQDYTKKYGKDVQTSALCVFEQYLIAKYCALCGDDIKNWMQDGQPLPTINRLIKSVKYDLSKTRDVSFFTQTPSPQKLDVNIRDREAEFLDKELPGYILNRFPFYEIAEYVVRFNSAAKVSMKELKAALKELRTYIAIIEGQKSLNVESKISEDAKSLEKHEKLGERPELQKDGRLEKNEEIGKVSDSKKSDSLEVKEWDYMQNPLNLKEFLMMYGEKAFLAALRTYDNYIVARMAFEKGIF